MIQNRTISVGLLDDPPYSILYNSDAPGICVEIVSLFCQMSHLNCRFGRENNGLYGHKENGTWNGMIKLIQDGIYDISFPMFTPSQQRFEVVDFTPPLTTEELLFVTRRPSVSITNSYLLHSTVFNWNVWISLVLFSVALGIYVAIIDNSDIKSNKVITAMQNAIDLFSYVTDQEAGKRSNTINRISIRCLLSIWGLAILVLSGLYSGSLVSSLLNGSAKLPFKDLPTFVECVERKMCELISYQDSASSASTREILESNDSLYLRLQKFINHDKFFLYTHDEVLNVIAEEKSKYLTTVMNKLNYLSRTNSNNFCLFSTVSYKWEFVAFPASKKFSLKHKLDLFADHVVESSLVERITSKYIKVEPVCENDIIRRDLQPVNIFGFFSSAFMLGIGCFVGCFVLILEKLNMRFYRHFSRKILINQ